MREPNFVRPLSDAECEALKTGLRSQDAFVLRRCQILLAMPFLRSEGKTAYRIAQTCGCHDQTVLLASATSGIGLTPCFVNS